jgi:hypothetical protein
VLAQFEIDIFGTLLHYQELKRLSNCAVIII